MTKAVTSVAAMQLVEQGRLKLDEPVARHLPQLARLDVIEGFDPDGKPVLRPANKLITLRHLLTHTSGFAYPTWSEEMFKYTQGPRPFHRASGSPGAAGFRTRHALAVRLQCRLGRTAGRDRERSEAGTIFPAQYSSAAGNERHVVHFSGGEVRSPGQPVSAAERRPATGGSARAAGETHRVQRRWRASIRPRPTTSDSCR